MVTLTCGYDLRNPAVCVSALRASARTSDLSKSKYASITSLLNISSSDGAGAAAGGGGGGAVTVTRAVALAEPPGPMAVIVYVVESVGVTLVSPSGDTMPTPGASVRDVAFVDDHRSVADCPRCTFAGVACKVTVGWGGGGGGAGAAAGVTGAGCLQPTPTIASAIAAYKTILATERIRIFSNPPCTACGPDSFLPGLSSNRYIYTTSDLQVCQR